MELRRPPSLTRCFVSAWGAILGLIGLMFAALALGSEGWPGVIAEWIRDSPGWTLSILLAFSFIATVVALHGKMVAYYDHAAEAREVFARSPEAVAANALEKRVLRVDDRELSASDVFLRCGECFSTSMYQRAGFLAAPLESVFSLSNRQAHLIDMEARNCFGSIGLIEQWPPMEQELFEDDGSRAEYVKDVYHRLTDKGRATLALLLSLQTTRVLGQAYRTQAHPKS